MFVIEKLKIEKISILRIPKVSPWYDMELTLV